PSSPETRSEIRRARRERRRVMSIGGLPGSTACPICLSSTARFAACYSAFAPPRQPKDARTACKAGFDTPVALWHGTSNLATGTPRKGYHMPKEEWGTKRICPTTQKRFYDLGKSPVISPYTGEVVPLDTGKGSRTM